ncbi:Uncharacterised protein [Mycobacteroides abscessus subsp. abscessus]|nr:Uncharacterised protein [Mycobacteroides abscessus subsp. abscessus]
MSTPSSPSRATVTTRSSWTLTSPSTARPVSAVKSTASVSAAVDGSPSEATRALRTSDEVGTSRMSASRAASSARLAPSAASTTIASASTTCTCHGRSITTASVTALPDTARTRSGTARSIGSTIRRRHARTIAA